MVADKVFQNGFIYSIEMDDTEYTYEAMAIAGDKIVGLGSTKEMQEFVGDGTEVIDLEGKMILPSFSNSHGHMSFHAEYLFTCPMNDTIRHEGETKEHWIGRYIDMMQKFYDEHPERSVIRGSGFTIETIKKEDYPSRYDLDKISTEKPIIVQSDCHHFLWCNSKALEIAGITSDTMSPRSSVIYKDENGEPTGIIQEFAAMRLIEEGVPGYDFTVEEYKEAIQDFCNNVYGPMGVAICFDAIPTENGLKAYEELAREDKLNMRFRVAYKTYSTDSPEQFDRIIKDFKSGKCQVNDCLMMKSVKFFNDGVSDGCLKEEEYPGQTGYMGYTIWDYISLREAFAKLLKAGLHIQIHSIAEGTVRETINAMEWAQKTTGIYDRRNNITHLSHMNPREVPRMKALNMLAAVQPYWMSGMFASENMTEWDIENSDKNKSLMDAGIIVCGSDDFPVSGAVNPLEGIQIGMTRHYTKHMLKKYEVDADYSTLKPYCKPEECASLKQMIKCYTINGAYANFLEDITGSLVVGKSADFVVLDKNLFEVEVDSIEDTQVEMAFFKGRKLK